LFALPERWVTVHSGDMGYASGRFLSSNGCSWRRLGAGYDPVKITRRVLQGLTVQYCSEPVWPKTNAISSSGSITGARTALN
jgi:hypothetical protein